jgi:hypothetical protein
MLCTITQELRWMAGLCGECCFGFRDRARRTRGYVGAITCSRTLAGKDTLNLTWPTMVNVRAAGQLPTPRRPSPQTLS